MQSSQGKIGIFPIFSVMILAIGLMNHVLVIPPLLYVAKRDAWFTVLCSIAPYLIWGTLLYWIMKKTKQESIVLWLKRNYGKSVSWAFRIFFIFYTQLIGVTTTVETTFWTKISYLPKTPKLVVASSLIIVCVLAAKNGIRGIAIASGILLPFVVVFGDFVMSSNLPQKDYSLLFPLMEHGIQPILAGAVYLGGGLVEFIVILLLQHQMKSKIRLWQVYSIAMFLILLVFGPVTGAIAEFGPYEASVLRFPAFEEWRLVKIGRYITHVDFLSIYQWLSGAVIRISLAAYLFSEMFQAAGEKAKSWLIYGFGAFCIIITMLPFGDMQYLTFMRNLYFPGVFFGVLLLSFVLFVLVLFAKKDGGIPNET
jgi:spore germination protein (amino acid permease)